jgi:hypothetical protein
MDISLLSRGSIWPAASSPPRYSPPNSRVPCGDRSNVRHEVRALQRMYLVGSCGLTSIVNVCIQSTRVQRSSSEHCLSAKCCSWGRKQGNSHTARRNWETRSNIDCNILKPFTDVFFCRMKSHSWFRNFRELLSAWVEHRGSALPFLQCALLHSVTCVQLRLITILGNCSFVAVASFLCVPSP